MLKDGRKSALEIAKETGLSKEVVQKNYEKMEQEGVIKGATIHINYKSFGCKAVAYMQITIDPLQADQFLDHIKKNPGIYSAQSGGPKGNVNVVTAFKTLHQLDEIKSSIRQDFSISQIRTSIWTDVKEMHENLRLTLEKTTNAETETEDKAKTEKVSSYSNSKITIDEIDEKIADKLSENGRAPLEKIAKEIGISADTAKRRYEKLTKNGIIKVTIQIDPTRIGYEAAAIFFAVTSDENSSSIIEKISRVPDVISIMKTTGDYDLQIWVLLMDVNQLLNTQDELGKIQGITKMDLQIVRMPNKWPTPRQYISTV